jgi:outer membrane lipoprotein-sorting protein
VIEKLGHAYDSLNDYVVTVRANVDVERLRVPKMEAKVYFKQPDKIHFESSGFAMLPREGVFNPFQFTKNKTGKIIGSDTVAGAYVLKVLLEPAENKKGGPGVTIFVDTTRWIVLQAETQPYTGRNVRATFSYEKTESWWLPRHVEVLLDTQTPEENEQAAPMAGGPDRGGMKMPRKGKVTIDYTEYKVNQGISDEIFLKDKKNPK